jgi:hypothetical protein
LFLILFFYFNVMSQKRKHMMDIAYITLMPYNLFTFFFFFF